MNNTPTEKMVEQISYKIAKLYDTKDNYIGRLYDAYINPDVIHDIGSTKIFGSDIFYLVTEEDEFSTPTPIYINKTNGILAQINNSVYVKDLGTDNDYIIKFFEEVPYNLDFIFENE